MRLTRYTDYALRIMLYLGARADTVCSIAEIAKAYGISQNHLMKVANDLVNTGYLKSVRGRNGGITLSKPPTEINIGQVVRHTEDGFELADCANCVIAPACGLTGALAKAVVAFLRELDGYSLADLLIERQKIGALLAARNPSGHSDEVGVRSTRGSAA